MELPWANSRHLAASTFPSPVTAEHPRTTRLRNRLCSYTGPGLDPPRSTQLWTWRRANAYNLSWAPRRGDIVQWGSDISTSCPFAGPSHQPLLLLFDEVLRPAASQLQVQAGLMRQVVQVQTSWCLLGNRLLNLGALMPFIERGDGDNLRPHCQGCLQGCLIVLAIDPVPCIVVVPGPNAGVNVARPHTGNEHEVVGIAEVFHSFPVLMGGAEGETVGGKR